MRLHQCSRHNGLRSCNKRKATTSTSVSAANCHSRQWHPSHIQKSIPHGIMGEKNAVISIQSRSKFEHFCTSLQTIQQVANIDIGSSPLSYSIYLWRMFSLASSSLSVSAVVIFFFFFFLSSSFFFLSLSGRMSSSQARSCWENIISSSFRTTIRPRICTREPSEHACTNTLYSQTH